MNKVSLGLPDWPEVGDLVVATVKRVESYGAYVTLDEYGGKEGLLHISEISSRWVRNIRNHVRPNQKVVLQVLRTDPRKGQIDLSLRRVSKDETRKKLEAWKKARRAEALLGQVAEGLGMELEDLYHREAFKLVEKYGSLFSGFEEAAKRGEEALLEAGLSPKVASAIAKLAREKIQLKTVTVQGIVEISSLSNHGVREIKEAFAQAAQKAQSMDAEIRISTMGPPKYRLELEAEDYKKAEQALEATVNALREAWRGVEGSFDFKRV